MSDSNPVRRDDETSMLKEWGQGELAPGDYEFHFWAPDAEFIGSRIQGRWTFARKEEANWNPTPATEELIDLAEEFVARREAQRTA
jgi:hypothetical protein